MGTDAPDAGGPAGLDFEMLRRSLDVRILRDGTITMKGEPVTHQRIRDAVLRGLDRTDDGDLCFRFGGKWAYVTAEDTPLRVRHLTVEGDRIAAVLDDGRTLHLPADRLHRDGSGLWLSVPSIPSGRPLAARPTNAAATALADHLAWDGDAPVLVLGGRRLPIPYAPQPGGRAGEDDRP